MLYHTLQILKKEKIKNKRHVFYKLNISDNRILKILKNKISKIVNFAAETHVDNSIKSSKVFFLKIIVCSLLILFKI